MCLPRFDAPACFAALLGEPEHGRWLLVVFTFYPITALRIILLALLNDIPILAIAYDNTKVDPKPIQWNRQSC